MPIPDYPSLLLPVLQIISEGNGADHAVEEIRERIASQFSVTPEELAVKQKSGTTEFVNYVALALAQLNIAKTIARTQKGVYRIAHTRPNWQFEKLERQH
jgi:restriction endonuclease Mrr